MIKVCLSGTTYIHAWKLLTFTMGKSERVEQVKLFKDYIDNHWRILEFLETWSLCSREYICLVILLAFFVLIILLGNLYGYVSHSHWSYCHFTWFECTKYTPKKG